MMEKCNSDDCCYARFCLKSERCATVTNQTKKGIANSVAHTVCSDWQIPSVSSLLESDGRRLETLIQEQQTSKGYTPCFRAPY